MDNLNQAIPAIAVVNNPTQLLFAIEAAHKFSHKVNELHVIVVPTPGARDMHLYENLFQTAGIHNIDELGTDSLTRAGRLRDVIRLRQNIDPAATILTCMTNYLPARALIGRAGENAVITDDGSWTIYFAKMRESGKSQYRTPLHAVIPFGRLPSSLTFFTVYSDIIGGKSDRVVTNELNWTKNSFFRGNRGSHLVVLGSDLTRGGYTEGGYFSEGRYLQYVERMRRLSDGPAEYWPHRRESAERAAKICLDFDMHLKERTLPLEAEIIACDPSPAIVATLPSTATRTLRLLKELMGYKIVVSLPRSEHISPSGRTLFETVANSAESDADELILSQ
jgi:hypothetical protein